MEAILEPTITLDPDKEYEIVDGVPEEKEMAGARHGRVGARLLTFINYHVITHDLGVVYGPDTTFKMERNERLPDIAFVAAERIPEEGDPEGSWNMAPDLAIEIISPNDVYVKVMNKVFDYFEEGVKQVWLVSPEHHTVTIYYSVTDDKILGEHDFLTCEELLPGFQCKVGDLFTLPKKRQ
ncbi:MAG: Uma2 family endonuclease [Blastocatellia bacterium]|nr:Uma2 family endonuclease [Blastocatellia bacterium]